MIEIPWPGFHHRNCTNSTKKKAPGQTTATAMAEQPAHEELLRQKAFVSWRMRVIFSPKMSEDGGTVAIFRGNMMINMPGYAWILLIVEISTPKPKSINFAKFKRKRTPERLFPLQNAFFNSRTLTNGFERFFLTLFERFLNAFFHSRTSEVSGTAKTTLVFFFPHQPQNRSFLGLELKNAVFGSSRY